MPLTASDALSLLEKAQQNDRLAHAYLITGQPGSGKRQLASQLCALLTGASRSTGALQHPDVHTIEPESKSRRIVTEQIRELEGQLQRRSSQGGRKVGIIFDADRLQPQASNAFLKTLEEPPPKSHLILVTALPDQLLETILSRCIQIPLQSRAKRELTSRQKVLLQALQAASLEERADLPAVFGLVREFQKLLTEAKEAAQAAGETEQKREEVQYKNIADSKWFEEREDYFKALTESRYVAERTALLDNLEQWWADALRQQAAEQEDSASVLLDFPEFAAETGMLARRFSPYEALTRASAFENLRDQLRNPGVNEALAIEVAFSRAFGSR